MENNKTKYQLLLIVLIVMLNPYMFVYAQVIDTKITHTVKSGETLHSITRSYLGTDILWKENWKLNPHIQDPHVLTIGEELIIIKQREIPAQKATMLEVVNKVQRKKNTGDWLQASKGDQLIQKEGVRTFDKSSVLLKLNNASQFKILEFSQVFLQSRETTLRGTDTATIEIIKGDAELSWDNLDVAKSEISIISGSTTLQPSTQKGIKTALRTGVLEDGNSVISVYKGDSQVESAGKQVAIAEGMGMKVKKGQAPPKPTRLLKAPLLSKLDDVFNYSNPKLLWKGINKADSYLVEICIDIDCNQVVLQKKVTNNIWQIADLNRSGQFYWRVAGIDKNDIVGFRSQAQSLVIADASADEAGPLVALDVLGTKKTVDGVVVVSPNTIFNILSYDRQSGVNSVHYRWDNGLWQDWHDAPVRLSSGAKTFVVKAVDHLDNISQYTYKIMAQ